MTILQLILSLNLSAQATAFESPLAFLIPNNGETNSRSSAEPELAGQIATSMAQIMNSRIGLGICREILNGDAQAIEHHLGVDSRTALRISKNCGGPRKTEWISPSPPGQIEKLSVNGSGKRTYVFVINGDSIPFDSWTEPFSNTTVFVIHSKRDKPINRQRLMQLLAHETAVYFDSKALLGHWDAASLPELNSLSLSSNAKHLGPKVAVMNPIIAHTLTFVRALKVEREIVKDLVERGQMDWPEEYKDPLIAELLSDQCGHACLSKVVRDMSQIYLPLSLPLVALAPTYRTIKRYEIQALAAVGDSAQWQSINEALDTYPRSYIQQMENLKRKPFMELIQIFATPIMSEPYLSVERSFRSYLWPEDWHTVQTTTVLAPKPMSLLEFMKTPLLSGYNILLSNGPRVRIRAGDAL